MNQKPTIGRIVHFVLGITESTSGEHRPAIITRVYAPTCVNLHVFGDAGDLGRDINRHPTSVQYDPSGEASNSWHWPEREE